MSDFFQDRGEPYRIFIRRQPYKGDGGTGLTRSFLFGWGTGKAPTLDGLKDLLAHEMAHNWPSLDGDHADTFWYNEGSAEYYSELLLLRSGLHTSDQFLKGANKKAEDYYTNPLQHGVWRRPAQPAPPATAMAIPLDTPAWRRWSAR